MKTLSTFLFSLLLLTALSAQSSIRFDGTTNQVEYCHDEAYNIGDGFTIEAWIYASEWRAEWWRGSIVTKDQAVISGYAFRAGQNGTLSLAIGVNGTNWPEITTDPIMNTDQWYHVAARISDNTMTLFVNGASMASGTFNGTPSHNDEPGKIGTSSGFPGRDWNGFIDEVRIWNVARSDDEINDNQTVNLTGNEPGLIAYFPMDEGSGTEAANAVSGGCPATGIPAWGDGYSVPPIDLGIASIIGPDVISIYERPVKVTVMVQNYGSDSATDFPVELSVNGLPTLTENFTGTLQPGETTPFTFSTALDLTENGTNLISVTTSHAEDDNGVNNDANYRYRRLDQGEGTIVTVLNEEQHNFGSAGQVQFTELNLPVHNEEYERILLHFSVECPSGGCDPWDQPAAFYIVQDERDYEIARYVTPYRIPCGAWTVDITDFKPILRGPVALRSLVQVWGPSGWLVNAEMEFIDADAPAFVKTTGLWETDYQVYGEPTISYDLPERSQMIATNTQSGHFRMTISGHGQGNTDNAAEFARKVHDIVVDGQSVGEHIPWKQDCGQNPCANQQGTWTLSRAGWCPGQQVTPFIFDLDSEMTPGEELAIDYVLEDYTNLDNTGYNGSSHTEPHFRIHSFLVEESDMRYEAHTNLRADSVLYMVEGDMSSLGVKVTNTGTTPISSGRIDYYIDGVLSGGADLTTTIAAGQSMIVEVESDIQLDPADPPAIYGVLTVSGDENISDDGTLRFGGDGVVNVIEANLAGIDVFPNPTAGTFTVSATLLVNGNFEIYSANGQRLQTGRIRDAQTTINLKTAGLYFLHLQDAQGQRYFTKVVVK